MRSASPPIIFDRSLIRARLRRAVRGGAGDFLLERAADDLIERLQPVQRGFNAILDLGTPRPNVSRRLAHAFPNAAIVRAAPLAEVATTGHSWQSVVADEELNPFRPELFDLAVSILALHTLNDLPGAFAQIRRTLKPDGLFLAALIGGQSLQELRHVLAEAEAEAFGGASPRVAPFADLRDLGHLLQRAGFALPVTDVDRVTVRYGSFYGLVRDLRAMGATNALTDRRRTALDRRFVLRAAELYAAQFSDPDGKIRATFDIVWLSGWAPHESQQKPLKPGSAKMRLADALGIPEQPLRNGGGT